MKKIVRNNILGFILGSIVFGSIGVCAATLIASKDVTYSNRTVEDALNELYIKANAKDIGAEKMCKFIDNTYGAYGEVGSEYECEVGEGIKKNFYLLTDNGDTVDLIMDRNINNGMMNWYTAMKYFRTGDGVTYKTNWTNVLNVDLPKVQAIVDAVGRTDWIASDSGETYWYFDKNGNSYGQTQVANESNPSNYAWLFNHLTGFSEGECTQAGCTDASDASAYGYWTRDVVANASRVWLWYVDWAGYLSYNPISSTDHGVRPVITVLKSNLYS